MHKRKRKRKEIGNEEGKPQQTIIINANVYFHIYLQNDFTNLQFCRFSKSEAQTNQFH